MSAHHSLALDHLTVADTTPSQLIEIAGAVGARAVCMFLEPMAVLPRMPWFDLYGPTPERYETKLRMNDLGIGLDLAYPFTLSGRTDVAAFRPALETASFLGARAVNVLVYDREPARRTEVFERFCILALAHGLQVALEFYPPSQVRTLTDAVSLAQTAEAPGQVGVNVDLLHLIRSGNGPRDLLDAPPGAVFYAQFCDAPATCAMERREGEASSHRLYPGEGELDVAGFAEALPYGVSASVEAPREDLILAGVPPGERARRAVEAVLKVTADHTEEIMKLQNVRPHQ